MKIKLSFMRTCVSSAETNGKLKVKYLIIY